MFSVAPPWRIRSRAAALAVTLALLVPSVGMAEDGGLEARVRALEAEIASLKVMVGTLESLVRATPSGDIAPGETVPSDGAQDALDERVRALETQIGALTSQLEQMGAHMTTPPVSPEAEPWGPQTSVSESAPMSALTEEPPAPETAGETATETVDPRARWYGPRPDEVDDGAPKSIMPPGAATGALPGDMPQSLAALPGEEAQALYEQGYGDYLRHDYAGAEKAFGQLVRDHPGDPLAGSAQYWVGETYYARKQYQKAADTFLEGYRKYASSDKAPDSLLKLGMSLAALGKTDAACNTFKKLDDEFPDAPSDVRTQANSERKKAGC